MQSDSNESLEAFKEANLNTESGDYLFYVMKFHETPSDFVLTVLEWAIPSFLIHDGLLFIGEYSMKPDTKKSSINTAENWLSSG
jgi:hypothetical protein